MIADYTDQSPVSSHGGGAEISPVRVLPWLIPAIALALCWLALWLAHPTVTQPWPFQALFAVAFLAYGLVLVQMPQLTRLSGRAQVTLVISGALLFHLTLLPAPFALSDDIFRYVWDGRVSAAGIDPYRYPPGDPALAPLRDEVIWPFVNAKDQASPYPPLLEAWFALVYRIWPENLLAMKLAMSLLNMGVIGLLLALLHVRGQPLAWALIYAWNPQVTLQVAFSGHNEPLLLLWLLLGLLLGARTKNQEPRTNRAIPSGSRFLVLGSCRLVGAWALALATLSKLVPVLALPVLWRRWGWRAACVYVATIGAVYGALLVRGQNVFDGVSSEINVAQFNDGLHYLVDRVVREFAPSLAPAAGTLLMVCGIGATLIWLLRQRDTDMVTPIGTLLAVYVLLAASVAPWYALWVLPFVTLDALPRLGRYDRRGFNARIFGGYWWLFSWTATFSELYYLGDRSLWRIAHVLEYAIPAGVMLVVWLWTRRRGDKMTR